MPIQIQNADSSERLRNAFGLKGHVSTSLDEIIVPTADVGDYDGKSPWEARRIGGDTLEVVAAGVGRYGYVVITPGAGTKLVVESITCVNLTGASVVMSLKLFRPADVQGTTTLTTPAGCWNLPISPAAFIPQMAAFSRTIHHNVLGIGAVIQEMYSVNTQTHDFRIPRGIVLDGTDPLGPISVGVMCNTANALTPKIGWTGAEYVARL